MFRYHALALVNMDNDIVTTGYVMATIVTTANPTGVPGERGNVRVSGERKEWKQKPHLFVYVCPLLFLRESFAYMSYSGPPFITANVTTNNRSGVRAVTTSVANFGGLFSIYVGPDLNL